MEGGVVDDRELASLHRAVEGLGDDPRPDALQSARVELGLTQDVEPQRRVLDQRRSLGLGEPAELVTCSPAVLTPQAA